MTCFKPFRFAVYAVFGLLSFGFTPTATAQSNGAYFDLNFTASLSTAEISGQPPINADTLQIQLNTPIFTVSNGDTVRANVMFSNGESFQLLSDPLDPVIGMGGRLNVGPNSSTVLYAAESGFSFSFLDGTGTPILSGFSARAIRFGGDLLAGVAILQGTTIDVYGLSMEFSNITNHFPCNHCNGNLPIEIGGVGFSVTNGLFGSPFAPEGSVSPIPEPETYAMLLAGLGLLGLAARRRKLKAAKA